MSRKHYFEVCPICGANLDPGEHCDCTVEVEEEKYSVIGGKKDDSGNLVPILDIPLVSDEKWIERANSPENQRMLSELGINRKVAAV